MEGVEGMQATEEGRKATVEKTVEVMEKEEVEEKVEEEAAEERADMSAELRRPSLARYLRNTCTSIPRIHEKHTEQSELLFRHRIQGTRQ
jgi:hypothetical protein